MNDLIIREINFNGDNLITIKEVNTDKIYVGVSYICQGIGLTRKKADYEISRIQSDIVLKQGTRKIGVASTGGVQESILRIKR